MTFISDTGSALPWMIAVFVAAAVLSLVLTPAVRRLVTRHGVIDRPEAVVPALINIKTGILRTVEGRQSIEGVSRDLVAALESGAPA